MTEIFLLSVKFHFFIFYPSSIPPARHPSGCQAGGLHFAIFLAFCFWGHGGRTSRWNKSLHQVLQLQASTIVHRWMATQYEIRNNSVIKKHIQMIAYLNSIAYLCSTETRERSVKSAYLFHSHKSMYNLSNYGENYTLFPNSKSLQKRLRWCHWICNPPVLHTSNSLFRWGAIPWWTELQALAIDLWPA